MINKETLNKVMNYQEFRQERPFAVIRKATGLVHSTHGSIQAAIIRSKTLGFEVKLPDAFKVLQIRGVSKEGYPIV